MFVGIDDTDRIETESYDPNVSAQKNHPSFLSSLPYDKRTRVVCLRDHKRFSRSASPLRSTFTLFLSKE